MCLSLATERQRALLAGSEAVYVPLVFNCLIKLADIRKVLASV